jgi:predicted component of type VI protein secretion system
MNIKIRQETIDKMVERFSPEELAKEMLKYTYLYKKENSEAEWLDELVTIWRDDCHDMSHEELNSRLNAIYKDHQDRVTDLMDIYRDRNNEGK